MASVLVLGAGSSRAAYAQERWVDDPQVLAVRRFRLGAGFGLARLASRTFTNQTVQVVGSGMSLEEAAGLGRNLELGIRFGLRLDDAGRGLRADELARGFDTETFGTGLSVAANPELRLRWRACHWAWGEAGLEDRLVLPTEPDPSVTEVLGAWGSVHLRHVARLDVGVNGVLGSESFAARRVLRPAVGLPIALWGNVTSALFVGFLTTTHYFAATPYTTSYGLWEAGLGVGYRFTPCDVIEETVLPDVLGDFVRRAGIGIGLSCRI